MSITAAKIVNGVKTEEFAYHGDPANLPVSKGDVRIVPVVEVGRDQVDDWHALEGPVETIEQAAGAAVRVVKTWTPVVRPAAEIRDKALASVDADAEAIRLKFITAGAGQALVYEAKRREAARWAEIVAAQGTPNPLEFPLLKARAERLNPATPDYQAVVDEWNARAAAWTAAAAAIEAVREGAKEAIAQAATGQAIFDALAGLVWPQPA